LSGGISATADYNKGERGDRKRQHSIRIHDQRRPCFVWLEENVYDMIEREVRPAVLAAANAAS
jgi:plasmid maintenance system killer protein